MDQGIGNNKINFIFVTGYYNLLGDVHIKFSQNFGNDKFYV